MKEINWGKFYIKVGGSELFIKVGGSELFIKVGASELFIVFHEVFELTSWVR